MAGSDLNTELRHGTERTIESLLSAARADAKQLASEADRRIEGRRREVMEDKEAEYGADARIAIAAEKHAAMRAVLLARTRLVDRVLERARALLPEAARVATYLSDLSGEVAEALQFVDRDGAVVRCSADLAPAVREALGGRQGVTVQTDEAEAGTGFIVVGAGGSVLVDGRLETRLDRLASALAIEIHAQLQEL